MLLQGYIYKELVTITHSDITACEKMADWLADKLKTDKANVKFKVLSTIKVCLVRFMCFICVMAGSLLAERGP